MKKSITQPNKYAGVPAEIAGWYGAVAILLAYALVSFNIISSEGWIFQLLNFTGAVGVIIIAYARGVKQSVLLNIFWALIALIALVKIFF